MNKWTKKRLEELNNITDHMEETLFTSMEKLIIEHLIKSDDGFIAVNETGLYEQSTHELFSALGHLEELYIIRKKNCEADAYEWNDKTVLLEMLR